MTSVKRQSYLAQNNRASKAFIGSSSNKSDNRNYIDLLESNKLELFKAFAGLSEISVRPKALARLFILQNPSANRYSQQDLDKIIQTFLHIWKSRSGNKLKAKTPDVYYGRSHMECYNFCQHCEDHFPTAKAIEPNQIPFATFFLWDLINFCWQQHKRKLEGESSVLISWIKFKAFFHKFLGNSQAFVNSY